MRTNALEQRVLTSSYSTSAYYWNQPRNPTQLWALGWGWTARTFLVAFLSSVLGKGEPGTPIGEGTCAVFEIRPSLKSVQSKWFGRVQGEMPVLAILDLFIHEKGTRDVDSLVWCNFPSILHLIQNCRRPFKPKKEFNFNFSILLKHSLSW